MKNNILYSKESPIFSSLLEIDIYKILMLQFIWKFYPKLSAKFEFINRTDILLAEKIDIREVKSQYEHLRGFSFSGSEISYLASFGYFSENFLNFLKTVRLPELDIYSEKGQLKISASSLWQEVSLVETFILAIVSELYFRSELKRNNLSQKEVFKKGEENLLKKSYFLMRNPMSFLQFGLRRRASGVWERHVTKILQEKNPDSMKGVSNILVAKELGVPSMGTNAHELPMALYAVAENEKKKRQSVYKVLSLWGSLYPKELRIILPDAFGTDSFINGVSRDTLESWRGFRQDSGVPAEFGKKIISLYQKNNIDPKSKVITFSDGLDVKKMFRLYKTFFGQIGISFGWGTNLTNDLGIKPLSLVMKLTEAAGSPAVKLSDNIAKATGDKAEIERAKRIFNYSTTFSKECLY